MLAANLNFKGNYLGLETLLSVFEGKIQLKFYVNYGNHLGDGGKRA